MKITTRERKKFVEDYLVTESIGEGKEQIVKIKSKQDGTLIRIAPKNIVFTHKAKDLDFLIEHDIQEFYSFNNAVFYGYSTFEKCWWAWSPRVKEAHSYRIGSKVKKFSIAYEADCKEMLKEHALDFWGKSRIYERIAIENETEDGFDLACYWSNDPKIVKNEMARGQRTEHRYDYPEKWGKGEWCAETLEDAKEMSMACARHLI